MVWDTWRSHPAQSGGYAVGCCVTVYDAGIYKPELERLSLANFSPAEYDANMDKTRLVLRQAARKTKWNNREKYYVISFKPLLTHERSQKVLARVV